MHYHLEPEQPNRFEILETADDFYIHNSIFTILQKPTHATHFGYMDNVNRPLSLEEFEERLQRGAATRRMLYGLEEGEPYEDYLQEEEEPTLATLEEEPEVVNESSKGFIGRLLEKLGF